MALYHRSAFGLPSISLPVLSGLTLSEHAKARALERGVPLSNLMSFDPSICPVYQIETVAAQGGGETVHKVNYRKRLDALHDYNVCLNPTDRTVISC